MYGVFNCVGYFYIFAPEDIYYYPDLISEVCEFGSSWFFLTAVIFSLQFFLFVTAYPQKVINATKYI
jgi:hypothetical protein